MRHKNAEAAGFVTPLILFLLLLLFPPASRLRAYDFLSSMEHGTIEEKILAMRHLGYSGNTRAFWYLVKYLNFSPPGDDSDRTIRCRAAAAESLGRLRDSRAVPFLTERWKREESPRVKERIMFAFSFYRNDAPVEIIREGLSSDDEAIVRQSVLTAAYRREQSLADNILPLYDSFEEGHGKTAAAYALTVLLEENEPYRTYLAKSLSSRSSWVRYDSAHYIAAARLTEYLPQLYRALEIENSMRVRRKIEESALILRQELIRKKRLSDRSRIEQIIQ
ncbi:MAG: HEAT repeat domain-containing protein [Spirochaetota bacterium]